MLKVFELIVSAVGALVSIAKAVFKFIGYIGKIKTSKTVTA